MKTNLRNVILNSVRCLSCYLSRTSQQIRKLIFHRHVFKIIRLDYFEISYCDGALIAAMQKSPNTTFTKITLGFLVLCFYSLEFYKCFSLVLLLAAPTIVYINLAEPNIKVTRYCLERQPHNFPSVC